MPSDERPQRHPGRSIGLSLLLGIASGVLFGEYCAPLQVVGVVYVGLLQMTVLPYMAISLIAKLGRLDPKGAARLGLAIIALLLIFWAMAIVLIVSVSFMLPPTKGAAFFSDPQGEVAEADESVLLRFVPTNIFHSLSEEYVPAVVVFCVFLGIALIRTPGKEALLDLLDVCSSSLGRINSFLVRLAPIGLFMLSAAAAGTLQIDELARLQAYLLAFLLACFVAAFMVFPLLVSGLTNVGFRGFMRAAGEPLLTAFATGKLFVVLPQVVNKCDELGAQPASVSTESGPAPARVVVPLAYPLPHVGKVLAFVFISFAAWYVGRPMSPGQTAIMGSAGALSSFASPLVAVPHLLDEYQLPQDLLPLFILPGFITTRAADAVGVVQLMAVSLIVSHFMQGTLRIRWRRLAGAALAIAFFLAAACATGRLYLERTKLDYDLDDRFLALDVDSPHPDVAVYFSRDETPERPLTQDPVLERVREHSVVRVGYDANHLPYSYANRFNKLVGYDVELMHRLASRLDVRLEFVPYRYETLIEQLDNGEIDVAVSGLMTTPDRLLHAAFTEAYQTATIAIATPDYRREEFATWQAVEASSNVRLGVIHRDLAAAAQRLLPGVEIVALETADAYFTDPGRLDGLIIAAEEGAAWNILHPDYDVVIPRPIVRRPVGMAVRLADGDWLEFLNRWLELERLDGSLKALKSKWIEGAGANHASPRWSIMRDVLHWRN